MLREGAPLAFAVWAPPAGNPWAAIPGMTLAQRGHMPPPEPGSAGYFAMGDPDRVRELVTGAGFDDPELEEISLDIQYADEDELLADPRTLCRPARASDRRTSGR